MSLVGNADKDGTVNSDLAFWGDLAFAGHYDGFRIIDISTASVPQTLVDYFCRGPQNDVSVYGVHNRLLLFQSIDRPQTKENCDGTPQGSSHDTPISAAYPGQATFGFEGIRIFDVTNPRAPVFLDGIPTACGSHTHTLIPEERHQRLHLYVSSYPLGSNITPADTPVNAGPRCTSPHKKISIVTVPFNDPLAWTVTEKPLSDDTAPYPGAGGPLAPPFQACHDVQAFMKDQIAVASCAGDAQIWDISDPASPTSANGEPHTHISSPSSADSFEFIHSAVITWDGAYFAVMDETGGGGTAECDGSAPEKGGASEHGFYYFYPMVPPGSPAPSLLSRYMIPRPQGSQICVSHNANVLPVEDRYLMSAAYYQGGNTLVDFTDVTNPIEVAYSDLEDAVGAADSWSSYWYNDYIYVNGGLNRRGATGNRGLDVFAVGLEGRQLKTRTWPHMNPQTQETFRAKVADYDGNGTSDRSVYRDGAWYTQGQATVYLGLGGDIPVPADYDGNGRVERAVFRNGAWYAEGLPTAYFGLAGDIPVPGDYDGNGTVDRAVFRPSVGGWYVESQAPVFLGLSSDIPVPGDYDGNGTVDRAVFRDGAWYTTGQTTAFLGLAGDIPVPADYNGNGSTDRAVFRNGIWYTEGQATAFLGLAGHVPQPGDFDGNGTTDRAVFTGGSWYTEGQAAAFVGLGTDIPVVLPQAIYRRFF